MDFYPFPVIRHKGDISIEAMAEVIKAVLKGLLEVTWPVDVHEYLVRALGTQVQGHMLPFHPDKRCNHSLKKCIQAV